MGPFLTCKCDLQADKVKPHQFQENIICGLIQLQGTPGGALYLLPMAYINLRERLGSHPFWVIQTFYRFLYQNFRKLMLERAYCLCGNWLYICQLSYAETCFQSHYKALKKNKILVPLACISICFLSHLESTKSFP